MTIGILTAMDKEHDRIAALLDNVQTIDGRFRYIIGQLNQHTIVLQACGIGKVNAAVGTSALIHQYQPDCIISTGVAGGIDQQLKVMDVVVSDRLVHHDFNLNLGYERGEIQGLTRFFPADPHLVEKARHLNTSSVHIGLICTGDQFITSRTELDEIKRHFPDGLAVDMESAAIAQTCYLYDKPFVSFRIISDTPGSDGHEQQYHNFWDEMADHSFDITRRYLGSL